MLPEGIDQIPLPTLFQIGRLIGDVPVERLVADRDPRDGVVLYERAS